jgi:hypothetical protein
MYIDIVSVATDQLHPDNYGLGHVDMQENGIVQGVRVAPMASTAGRRVVTCHLFLAAAVMYQTYLHRHLKNMLDELPNEILHLILQNLATSPKLIHKTGTRYRGYDPYVYDPYFYYRRSWATLAQLCKVSRSMRHAAEPLLYRNYAKPDSTLDPDKHHAFRKYLVTVLGRPKLLQHVRSLHIGAWRYHPGEYRQHTISTAPNHDTPFPNKLHGVYREYANTSALGDDWRKALEAGEEVAEIALLMSLTPNLEHIEFCMPDLYLEERCAPQYFWPSLLVASGEWDPARHFHRLDSVMVHRRDLEVWQQEGREDHGFEVGPFLPFIGLPSLKTFWVENDAVGHYRIRPEDCPLKLKDEELHLTDLTLGISYMDPTKMMQILKRCTKLEAFHRELQRPNPVSTPGFSWKTIIEALNNSRGTLKELILNADTVEELSFEEPGSLETFVSIGPLTNFISLRIPDLPQSAILGFEFLEGYSTLGPAPPLEELLPSSLEYLTIGQCSLNIVPYLDNMLIKIEDKFPHLRDIDLIGMDLKVWDINCPGEERWGVMLGREVRVERLQEAYAAAGVHCCQFYDRDDVDPH